MNLKVTHKYYTFWTFAYVLIIYVLKTVLPSVRMPEWLRDTRALSLFLFIGNATKLACYWFFTDKRNRYESTFVMANVAFHAVLLPLSFKRGNREVKEYISSTTRTWRSLFSFFTLPLVLLTCYIIYLRLSLHTNIAHVYYNAPANWRELHAELGI